MREASGLCGRRDAAPAPRDKRNGECLKDSAGMMSRPVVGPELKPEPEAEPEPPNLDFGENGLGSGLGAAFGRAMGMEERLAVAAVGDASDGDRPRAGTIEEATSLSVRPSAAGGEKAEAEGLERDEGGVSESASAGMMLAGDELANEGPSRADPFFELLEAEPFFALNGEPTGEEDMKSRAGIISFAGSWLLFFFFFDSHFDIFAKATTDGSATSSSDTSASESVDLMVESDSC